MSQTKFIPALSAHCLLIVAGCAHTPPKELMDARAAYKQAADGPAREETPAQLHTAQGALNLAEATFRDEGASDSARDRAYVATRKAQIAEGQARLARSEKRLAQLEANLSEQQRTELARLRGEYAESQQALSAEQQARADAEARAERAAADLERIAAVSREARGMVITLSGEVLFASGKSVLLPTAQTKLTEVANALSQGNPEARIVVEGHTDSQGSQAFNLDLSTRRAQAVRDFLVSHGVAEDRIRSEGLGFSRPIADNKTAEGRANNRRVEIVIQPQTNSGDAQPGQVAPKG